MQVRTFLFLGVVTLFSHAGFSDWVKTDNFKKSRWFGSYNVLEEAQKHEKSKDYDAAADEYETLFEVVQDSRNKAHALFKKAQNLHLDGSRKSAFKTYKELIECYPTSTFYTKALDDLFLIGKEFEAAKGKLFADNESNAVEVYEFIIDTAPFYKNSAKVLLRLGNLQAGRLDEDMAVSSYKKLVKKYKNYEVQRAEAFIMMARVYDKMAESADQDCELTRQSLEYVNTFLENYPEHKRKAEAEKLKVKLTNRLGMYYYKLGLFYTWDANYCASATRRYLRKVLFEYTDTPAAAKAEALLASVDPDAELVVSEVKEVQKVHYKSEPTIQSKKMAPFSMSQEQEDWPEQPVLPAESLNNDKYLLPLPNLEGGEK